MAAHLWAGRVADVLVGGAVKAVNFILCLLEKQERDVQDDLWRSGQHRLHVAAQALVVWQPDGVILCSTHRADEDAAGRHVGR